MLPTRCEYACIAQHTRLAQPVARRQAPLCGETSASPSRQGLLRARPRVYSHPQSHIPRTYPSNPLLFLLFLPQAQPIQMDILLAVLRQYRIHTTYYTAQRGSYTMQEIARYVYMLSCCEYAMSCVLHQHSGALLTHRWLQLLFRATSTRAISRPRLLLSMLPTSTLRGNTPYLGIT